jgi:hypothetical protein
MNAIEVTILGGPFDGNRYTVRAGSSSLRLMIKPPLIENADDKSWIPIYEMSIPIYLTRNGYRADWALAEPTDPGTRSTGDTP